MVLLLKCKKVRDSFKDNKNSLIEASCVLHLHLFAHWAAVNHTIDDHDDLSFNTLHLCLQVGSLFYDSLQGIGQLLDWQRSQVARFAYGL